MDARYHAIMTRVERTDVANYVYHLINRAKAQAQAFDTDEDYKLFEEILTEAVEKFNMDMMSG